MENEVRCIQNFNSDIRQVNDYSLLYGINRETLKKTFNITTTHHKVGGGWWIGVRWSAERR
jgi:hypothetical protein